MRLWVFPNQDSMGAGVAHAAGDCLQQAINRYGDARLLVATGSSQFEVLGELVKQRLPWERISGFHLDEYVGIAPDHPASFCRYLRERFVDLVPLHSFQFLLGNQDPKQLLEVAGRALQATTDGRPAIDVALVGIGENGHLAFNDPPADFQTTQPYLIVQLDQACRQQQVGEGWFATLDEVPTHAISMSINQIMAAETIFCTVPDQRKAVAVKATLEGPVTPIVPASILQRHRNVTISLDSEAASKLSDALLRQAVVASSSKR